MKATLISLALRFVMGGIALGVGIWYLSSSLGGAALTYSSMGNFMTAIGAGDGDVANVNGCFLCGYVAELFGVIGRGAELFWDKILDSLWILMSVGFGIFVLIYSGQYIFDAAKKTTTLDTSEKKLELKAWFDKVWRQGVRILVAGALIGAVGMGGTDALNVVTEIVITPVLFVGAQLSMAATGVNDAATCVGGMTEAGIMNAIYAPFMCVIGNLNSVMLAGAAGGFALMNYAWMGLGGGLFTWLSGLGLVLLFLVIGFDLFFQILSVIFKLVFLVIFMPFLIAAYAFEGTWKTAGGIVKNAVNKMLVPSAVKIVAITLKILVTYAMVAYAADEYFPGPNDGYSAILPPMMGSRIKNPDAQTMSVINVFTTCERVALVDGEMDGEKFKNCFTAQRAAVERKYPGAFDFMDDGWDFLLLMIGIYLLYSYVISSKIDKILGVADGKEMFDFGGWMLGLGKKAWGAPKQIVDSVLKKISDK